MSRREAEEERQKAATLVQQAWSGDYKRACEVGGVIFVAMALTPYTLQLYVYTMEGGMERKKTRRSPGLVGPHTLAMMWGTTSSTNGSNTRGEPGRARRTALSHLRT